MRPEPRSLRPFIAAGSRFLRRAFAVFLGKLSPAVDAVLRYFAVRDRGLHGTPGFMQVGTIAEFASVGQLHDFGESRVDPLRHMADVQVAHAGIVDNPPAALHLVQRARRCRVAAFRIVFANTAGRLPG